MISAVALPDPRTVQPLAPPAAEPAPAAFPPEPRKGFLQWTVYITWTLLLFQPQWLIGGPARKMQTLITLVLLVVLMVRPPKRSWAGPLLAFTLLSIVTMPFAVNRIYAMYPLKALLVYYVATVATLNYIRTPREAMPLVAMVALWQWVWWIGWGLVPGLVPWHPEFANHDSYGPMMVIGAGVCVYFAQAVRSPWLRRIGYACALLCVGGVVSAFARGAVLTMGLVMALAWVRSPRKGRMTAAIALMLIVVVAAASLMGNSNRSGDVESGPTDFWTEMASSFKGAEDETGSDRMALWSIAWRLYLGSPVLGVGGSNYGPAAATTLRGVEIKGAYAENQLMLYDRALHNSFLQVLCEFGTVGAIVFVWILVDFFRRNRALRKRANAEAWARATMGAVSLPMLSLGIESGMVGYLGTAFFYNQLTTPWLYWLLATNFLLHLLATRSAAMLRTAPPGRPVPAPDMRPAYPALAMPGAR